LKVTIYLSVGLILSVLLAGCQTIGYYSQAVGGHTAIWLGQRDIAEVLADPTVDEAVKQQLRQLQQVREFASAELMLPRNDSYSRYVDTGREYVVWNVVATPRYSVEPVKSCFPVVGCVSYRGYYDREEAIGQAKKLKAEGLDVFVGGVGAYSTLGWFDDPLLNTMLSSSRADTTALVFHELAHQQIFLKGDTKFNESFATAVAEMGLNQWAREQGESKLLTEYRLQKARRAEAVALVLRSREVMQQAYLTAGPDDERLLAEIKSQQFKQMKAAYEGLKAEGRGTLGFDGFFAADLNHASLALFGEYHGWVGAFKRLFEQHDRDWRAFYEVVEDLSKLDKPEREARLRALLNSAGAIIRPPAST